MPRLLIVVLILAGCALTAEPGGAPDPSVAVVRVIDGDSLILDTSTGPLEVRLSGVNAPEGDECHHAEASEALAALVDEARLDLAIEGTDQFGRSLGRLQADGSDVAAALVRAGHGLAIAGSPDSSRLLAAEDAAYAEGIGMWAMDVCGAGSRPDVTIDEGASVTDPAGRDDQELADEVIVIVNREDHAVDISGWILRDGSSSHRFSFGSGVVLQAGARIRIHSADPGWSPGGGPVWSNDGDIALLLDSSGAVVARWRYDR